MWIIAWLGIIETEYEKNDHNNHLAKNILGSFHFWWPQSEAEVWFM